MSTSPSDSPQHDAGTTASRDSQVSSGSQDPHRPPPPTGQGGRTGDGNGTDPTGSTVPRDTLWTEAAEPDVLEQERGALPGSEPLLPASALRDDAAAHDVIDQVQGLRPHDPAPPSTAGLLDAAEYDVIEQAQDVLDEEDDYPAR